MKMIPDSLSARITDEDTYLPFKAFNWDFDLSAFQVESQGLIYECICLHRGNLRDVGENGVPIRIHSGCLTSEVFGSPRCDCAWQLKHSLEYIVSFDQGMLIYLPWQEGRGNGLFEKVRSFRLMNAGMTTSDAFAGLGLPRDNRDYAPALAILFRFGLTRIQLITNNPAKINAVRMAGIEIIKRIPSIMQTRDSHLLRYLNSKALQFGHLIDGGCNEEFCRSAYISNI